MKNALIKTTKLREIEHAIIEQNDVFAYLAKNKQYQKVCITARDRLDQLQQDGVSNTVLEKLKHLPSARRNLLSYTQLQTIIQALETQLYCPY